MKLGYSLLLPFIDVMWIAPSIQNIHDVSHCDKKYNSIRRKARDPMSPNIMI
jgi:hypothetical protein